MPVVPMRTAANLTRTIPGKRLMPAAPPMMDEALRVWAYDFFWLTGTAQRSIVSKQVAGADLVAGHGGLARDGVDPFLALIELFHGCCPTYHGMARASPWAMRCVGA